MAIPTTRQQLIDYCLRKLGAPVLEINIDPAQLSDRVDEAIQFYQNFHSDAVAMTYYKYQLTSTDITNQYITLPDSLIYVSRIFPVNLANSTQGIFSIDYQLHLNDLYDLRRPGSLINYAMTRQYMSTIDLLLNGADQGITFTRHANRLQINIDWTQRLQAGAYLIIEGMQTLDPNTYTKVYNDMFLKRYLTALIKYQWGENLIKFKDMQLPGGVTINGSEILAEAKEEIKDLEEKARSVWELPCDFLCG